MVSEPGQSRRPKTTSAVLILVLVEDGLGDGTIHIKATSIDVLILVLVEDGLGVGSQVGFMLSKSCLNPCFSGGWSRSLIFQASLEWDPTVLILVLVEDGLGVP